MNNDSNYGKTNHSIQENNIQEQWLSVIKTFLAGEM